MLIAGRIQRYVFLEATKGLLITLGVILGAILLIDMVEQMRTVGSRTELSLLGAFRLTVLKAPQLIQETLPFAVLVGSMLAFTKLNRLSELTAMRAAGVSAWRFLGPVMFLSVMLGFLTMMVLDPMATQTNATYEARREALLNAKSPERALTEVEKGVWLRQGDDAGQAVIHGQIDSLNDQSLENVEIFMFERSGREYVFSRRIDADQAQLQPGFWQLENVVETVVDSEPFHQEFLALPTTLDADTLLNRYASAKSIPFWKLPAFIQQTQRAGLEDDDYQMKFHSLLAMPVLLTAMALIGAVVCLRLRRSGGVSQLITAGAGAGFVLFFINQLSRGLAASDAAPPQAAAWCPPLFALFAVLCLIAYAEDG